MSPHDPQPEGPSSIAPGARPSGTTLPIHEDEATLEAIARFDELESDRLEEISNNPAARQILDRLREVDRWLESAVAENHGATRPGGVGVGAIEGGAIEGGSPTPIGAADVSADELYRFGKGRGSEPLPEQRQREVADFLADHPEEARWTKRLAEPVPAPLDVGPIHSFPPIHLPGPRPGSPSLRRVEDLPARPAAADAPVTPGRPTVSDAGQHSRRAPRALAPWVRWVPAAAAALMIAMVLDRSGPTNALDGGLPESPVLRSASSATLLFPRGRVLAPVDGLETYASRPLFEVASVAGAERYRFELRLNAGGVFDQGDTIWTAESTSRSATADRLEAGAYEWSAWATVNGIEKDLGTLSFVVVPTDHTWLLTGASGANAGPSSTREDVRQLHSAGFLSDARYRARDLAPGAARAAYLAEDR